MRIVVAFAMPKDWYLFSPFCPYYQIKQWKNYVLHLSFLRQSISMEIQRGNCARILGIVESPKLLEELFELFKTKSDHYHS